MRSEMQMSVDGGARLNSLLDSLFGDCKSRQVALMLARDEVGVKSINDLEAVVEHLDERDCGLTAEDIMLLRNAVTQERRNQRYSKVITPVGSIANSYLMDCSTWTRAMYAQYLITRGANGRSAFFSCTSTDPMPESVKRETAASTITRAARVLGRNRIERALERRALVVGEIVSTETSYVSQLDTVVRHVLGPARESGLLSAEQVRAVFSDITAIHTVNAKFLEMLQRLHASDYANALVGGLFLKMAPLFKLYGEYCMNYHDADAAARELESGPFGKWYKTQIETLAPPEYRKFRLSSFLITPVQRLPRYKMLLGDLLKFTPACHPDHEDVVGALKIITEVTTAVDADRKSVV